MSKKLMFVLLLSLGFLNVAFADNCPAASSLMTRSDGYVTAASNTWISTSASNFSVGDPVAFYKVTITDSISGADCTYLYMANGGVDYIDMVTAIQPFAPAALNEPTHWVSNNDVDGYCPNASLKNQDYCPFVN